MGVQKIGRYQIIHELGRGGMATVYLARDPSFEREVAIKVLPIEFTHDPQFLARFRREAKVIAALEHPYIVPVYDYGEEGEQPFIVMRYMTGGTLANRIAGRPMPLAEIIAIVQRLAEALDEAHSRNIIHRDLKPANVMFDARGNAFLSDFGIAKLMEGAATLTGSAVIGTPAYMSPELAVGDKAVDGRSDVYALGIMVYEMLTGRHPYKADTPMRVMLMHIREPVPRLETAPLGLPARSNAILARALAKKPEGRYATAGAFAQVLSSLVTAPVRAAASPPASPGPFGDARLAPKPYSTTLPPGPAQPPPPPTHPAAGPAKVSAGPSPPTLAASAWRRSPLVLGFGLLGSLVIAGLVGLFVFLSVSGGGWGQRPTSTATVTIAPSVTHSPTRTPFPTATPALPSSTPLPPTFTSPPPTATHTSVPPTRTATVVATRRPPTREPATATQPPPTNPPPTNPPPPPPGDTPVPPPPPTNTPVPPEPTNTPVP